MPGLSQFKHLFQVSQWFLQIKFHLVFRNLCSRRAREVSENKTEVFIYLKELTGFPGHFSHLSLSPHSLVYFTLPSPSSLVRSAETEGWKQLSTAENEMRGTSSVLRFKKYGHPINRLMLNLLNPIIKHLERELAPMKWQVLVGNIVFWLPKFNKKNYRNFKSGKCATW